MAHRNLSASLLIGIVFSLAASYYLVRNIPLEDTFTYIKSINYWWILPSVGVAFLSYAIRAARWRIILSPVADVGFLGAYHPLVVSFMINSILPGRVGELARPGIICRMKGTPFSKVLATIIVERIFDIATLLLLFILFISRTRIDPGLSIEFEGYAINRATLEIVLAKALRIGVVIAGVIGMICVPMTRRLISSAVLNAPGILFFLPQAHRDKLRTLVSERIIVLLENLSTGFEILRSPGKTLQCLFLSFVTWIMVAYSFYLLILGCPNIEMTFPETFTVLIFICFFIMLPSVPGYWGIWEAGGIFGMMIFGVPRAEAAGVTLAFHVTQITLTILLGVVSSILIGVNVFQAQSLTPRSSMNDRTS